MKPSAILLPACFLIAGAATAAEAAGTPLISGTYLVTYIETCQAEISTSADAKSGDVNSVNTVSDGKISHTIGTAVFSQKAGTVSLNGFQQTGDLFILQNLGGQSVSDQTWSQNWTYTNTATALILNGNSFHAFYANVAGGIAKTVVFSGIPSSGCAATGTLVKE